MLFIIWDVVLCPSVPASDSFPGFNGPTPRRCTLRKASCRRQPGSAVGPGSLLAAQLQGGAKGSTVPGAAGKESIERIPCALTIYSSHFGTDS